MQSKPKSYEKRYQPHEAGAFLWVPALVIAGFFGVIAGGFAALGTPFLPQLFVGLAFLVLIACLLLTGYLVLGPMLRYERDYREWKKQRRP